MTDRMKLSFSSKPENERFARTVCAAFMLPLDPTVEEMDELKTAVSEAVTNSVIHGYGGGEGMIEIEGARDNDSVTYIIRDAGCGIPDTEKAREPLFSGSGDPERSGMGFSIMEAFCDELRVESRVGCGTEVTLVKRTSHNA